MISAQPLALPARCSTSIAGRYGAILADPPWQYDGESGNGAAAKHYNTVSADALAALPVRDLAADDCVLFLWGTWPKLEAALQVGKAWDFTYKTAAWVWVKQSGTGRSWHFGNGYWSRANAEVCLLFTRGNPKRKSASVHQLIIEAGQLSLFEPLIAPFTAHSAKPHEQYGRIESLLDGPYLELFARNSAPGWDAWGNEAPNCIDWRPTLSRAA